MYSKYAKSYEAALQQAKHEAAYMQQIQQMKAQQQAATVWTSKWDYRNDLYYTTASSNADTIVITGNSTKPAPPAKPKPETNLAWLDRRVNEMRVAL